MINLEINNSWDKIFQEEIAKEYFLNLIQFINTELDQGKVIYPQGCDLFNAFRITSPEKVKVVIIGQDPYHGPKQAHGLCFSVLKGNKLPPSLKNIYKELKADLNIEPADHGDLTSWAKQGVLMLNSVLSVEASSPGSHRKKGWEEFTDFIIKYLNDNYTNLVFILWGNDAKKKASSVDRSKHYVLESAHPSPFSVKKFYGNMHFSKTNNYLKASNKTIIDWTVY